MSKRILAVALALGILATSNAFASRSRTTVLGTGDGGLFLTGGTFFYDDARNIFYNPSYVNDFKNWGIIEKSNSPGTSAEGGFVSSLSSFNLGVYLNRVAGGLNSVAAMASTANQRPIEVFFGGDMNNVKWGIGVNHSMFKTAANGGQTDTNLRFSVGAQVADFEPFGWISAIGNEKTAGGGTSDNKYKSYGLGMRYKMGEWLPYLGWKQDKAPSGGNAEARNDALVFGLGRTTKIGEGARMNYAVSFVRSTFTNRSAIPLDVSVEADANSWLSARAGLAHNVYDKTGDASTADNTTGRIGMAVHVGKADLDFTIAKSGTANVQAEEVAAINSQVTDVSNGFFSQLSVGYHW